jgi:hypothetical protein
VFIAVASQTNIIKNLINKVKNPQTTGYFDPITQLQDMQYQSEQQPNFTQPLVPSIPEPSQQGHGQHHKKKKKHHYSHDNTSIHPTTADENLDYQYSQYNPYAPSYQQPSSSTTTIDSNVIPIHSSPTIPALTYPPPADTSNVQSPLQSLIHSPSLNYQQPLSSLPQPPNDQQVYAQIECPDDPDTLPCGSNCYMDGKLYKTVCDEDQRQALFPPSDQETPYNFNPYRSGGPSPPYSIPTGPGPSQKNIHPTTPDQNLQDQNSQYNATLPSYQQGKYLNTPWDKHDPCRPAGSKKLPSCRRQGELSKIGVNPRGSYRLNATVTNFDSNWHDMEITSGGPGSNTGCCCGVTLGVHGPSGDGDGYVYAKTEDWSSLGGKKHGYAKYLCDDSGHNIKTPCNNPPQRAHIIPGQPVHFMWQVQNVSGGAKYSGSVNGVPIDNPVLFNPRSYDDRPILPGVPHSKSCQASDPTRVRVDGAGKNVNFGPGLQVTPL